MSFTDLLNTTVNNSILVPTHFGEVGSNVSAAALGKSIASINTRLESAVEKDWSLDCNFKVKIKYGAEVTELTSVTYVSTFGMSRSVEKLQYGDYTVNLPGVVSYNDVMIKCNYTMNSGILDWLMAGVDQGASHTVNLIIETVTNTVTKTLFKTVTTPNSTMVLTLLDAKLTQWHLMDSGGSNSLDAKSDSEACLTENLTFSYSGIEIDTSSA